MRVLTVGFGAAGGRVVDELLARKAPGDGAIESAMAVNTAKADLLELDRVPDRNRVLIGQNRVKGHGVGADNELGAEIAEDDIAEIQEVIDRAPVHDIDAFLIVAGLGGGTGSGGAPVLAHHLKRIYTEPVLSLGILPSADEGGIYTLNAARSLPTLREQADATLLFDNDVWREESGDEYDQVNRRLVRRLRGALITPAESGPLETLSEGGDVATIGVAAEAVETGDSGILSRFTGGDQPEVDTSAATNRVTSLTRKATLGRLTLPVELDEASHASLIVDGPAPHLSRKGLERGRKWLEESADATATATEVETSDADHLRCTVVLAGLDTCPRIEELEQVRREAAEEVVEEATEPVAEDGEAAEDRSDGPAETAGEAAEISAGSEATTDPRQGASEPAAAASRPSGTESPSHAPAEIPGAPSLQLTYDDLEPIEPIGRGGNADVFRARVTGTDDGPIVALKEPRTSGTLHRETVERLLEEAETWSKLDDHDHVVGVVDFGSDPLPWIAMEYMDGGNLAERLAGEELPFAERRWVAIAVTRAVRQAHRRGVAHLDLKPENILFREVEGAWDVPKVADWGLSKHLLEHSKSVDGLSPGYAAPEQFDDEYGPTDDITDIYGLGAVLYELFTGRPPFEGSPMAVMRSIVTEEPTPPSEVADVPPAVDDALLPALSTRRNDRYEDIIRIRDALEGLPERG
jgi:cell division GTPase FtsZ/tRNA A-37 threonylcarbamoyl transferase component Bud32